MKSIDFKAAQCFISLNDSDLKTLNENKNSLGTVFHLVFSSTKDYEVRAFKLTDHRTKQSRLCTNYDVPMYVCEVKCPDFVGDILKKLTLGIKVSCCSDLMFSFFSMQDQVYLKYSCRCLENIQTTDFPVCSKLSRLIDTKVNSKLLETNLPLLFSENTDLMLSVQTVLEMKYSLDHMWRYNTVDSVKEWNAFNWILEFTLIIRRKYGVDLTLSLEPKYFGYPDAESVRISNDMKSLVVNSKPQGKESNYIKFIDTADSILEA